MQVFDSISTFENTSKAVFSIKQIFDWAAQLQTDDGREESSTIIIKSNKVKRITFFKKLDGVRSPANSRSARPPPFWGSFSTRSGNAIQPLYGFRDDFITWLNNMLIHLRTQYKFRTNNQIPASAIGVLDNGQIAEESDDDSKRDYRHDNDPEKIASYGDYPFIDFFTEFIIHCLNTDNKTLFKKPTPDPQQRGKRSTEAAINDFNMKSMQFQHMFAKHKMLEIISGPVLHIVKETEDGIPYKEGGGGGAGMHGQGETQPINVKIDIRLAAYAIVNSELKLQELQSEAPVEKNSFKTELGGGAGMDLVGSFGIGALYHRHAIISGVGSMMNLVVANPPITAAVFTLASLYLITKKLSMTAEATLKGDRRKRAADRNNILDEIGADNGGDFDIRFISYFDEHEWKSSDGKGVSDPLESEGFIANIAKFLERFNLKDSEQGADFILRQKVFNRELREAGQIDVSVINPTQEDIKNHTLKLEKYKESLTQLFKWQDKVSADRGSHHPSRGAFNSVWDGLKWVSQIADVQTTIEASDKKTRWNNAQKEVIKIITKNLGIGTFQRVNRLNYYGHHKKTLNSDSAALYGNMVELTLDMFSNPTDKVPQKVALDNASITDEVEKDSFLTDLYVIEKIILILYKVGNIPWTHLQDDIDRKEAQWLQGHEWNEDIDGIFPGPTDTIKNGETIGLTIRTDLHYRFKGACSKYKCHSLFWPFVTNQWLRKRLEEAGLKLPLYDFNKVKTAVRNIAENLAIKQGWVHPKKTSLSRNMSWSKYQEYLTKDPPPAPLILPTGYGTARFTAWLRGKVFDLDHWEYKDPLEPRRDEGWGDYKAITVKVGKEITALRRASSIRAEFGEAQMVNTPPWLPEKLTNVRKTFRNSSTSTIDTNSVKVVLEYDDMMRAIDPINDILCNRTCGEKQQRDAEKIPSAPFAVLEQHEATGTSETQKTWDKRGTESGHWERVWRKLYWIKPPKNNSVFKQYTTEQLIRKQRAAAQSQSEEVQQLEVPAAAQNQPYEEVQQLKVPAAQLARVAAKVRQGL
jgi:hypothetical protein